MDTTLTPTAKAALRRAGTAFMAGSVLWVAALGVHDAKHLNGFTNTAGYRATESIYLAATILLFLGVVGLLRARVTASRRVGRVFLWALAVGFAAICVGEALAVFVAVSIPALPAIAGLLNLVAAVVAGVSVARARVVGGWARWTLLGVGLVNFFVLLVPTMVLNRQDPADVAIVIWQAAWFAVGLSMLIAARVAATAPSTTAGATPILGV